MLRGNWTTPSFRSRLCRQTDRQTYRQTDTDTGETIMALAVSRTTSYLVGCDWIFFVISGCTPTWTSLADSNVLHGRLNAADSLSECQTACFDDADCTGVDWDPANGNGQYCWFSGSWSGRRNVNGAPGVTHYDLTRDCESKRFCVYCIVQGRRHGVT